MALYRHTATGFLAEFASNPGAGYTAISAMPTDTVANRVAWWRGLDTYGQTSSWHPSVTRDPQDPGEATISIQFSQDIALISSEPDGTITNPRDPTNSWYIGATTEVRVYRGITDVTITEGWTLTKVEEGCTSTLSEAGGLYTLKITSIPLLATNAGYVRITATRTGSGTFTKDFRFLKVFQGQDGAAGTYVSYVFKASATTPPTPTDTTPIPAGWLDSPPVSTDPVWMSKATVSGELAGTWSTPVKVTAIDGSDGSFTTYQYAKNTSFTTAPTTGWADTPYTLSAGEYQWMRTKTTDPNTGAVSYGAAYRVTGEKGADGAAGSSGIILDLDNENQTVAAGKDGTWISGTTATTTARLYFGATQLTSGITWSVQSATAGITYTPTNNTSSYTVSVTGMTAALATGTITIAAVYNGVTYTQVFTISKANAGADGTPATVYWLSTSASAIAKNAAGAYNPTSVSINAYSQTGTNAPAAYTGRFQIQTQAALNGAWTTTYSSAGNEASTSYSVPASIVAIRVYLYQAGGTSVLLDQETLPVVADGQPGTQGDRGSRQIVITGTANWSDQTAWQGILARFGGTAPVLSDLVTIVNTSAGTSTSKFYTGGGNGTTTWGTWETVTEYINGNLLVTGTVGANAIAANAINASKIAAGSITADRIDSRGLSIKDSAGNVILAAGTPLSSGNITPAAGWLNNNVTITNGAIQGIGTGAGTAVANSLLTASISAAATTANWATITNVPAFGGFAYLSSITSANISTYIAGAAIGTAYIADAAITSAKIASLSADKLTAGTINGSNITVTNLNATNITTGTLNGARVGTGVSGDVLTTGTLNAALCNVTNLNAANITTGNISASRIGAGTIDAAVINLNTASAVIKTSNFTLGTGFRISGDGTAFFYGASVSGSARSANWNGTVNAGTGQPTAGTGTRGWCIDTAGNAEFNTVMVRTKNIEGEGVTANGGYGTSGSFSVGNGGSINFWSPTRPAATYGRGKIAFTSRLTIRKTVSGDGVRITGFIQISRNGSTVRAFNFGGGTNQDTLNVPIVYLDDSSISSALNYTFVLTNLTSSGITIEQVDEYWVEFKR